MVVVSRKTQSHEVGQGNIANYIEPVAQDSSKHGIAAVLGIQARISTQVYKPLTGGAVDVTAGLSAAMVPSRFDSPVSSRGIGSSSSILCGPSAQLAKV